MSSNHEETMEDILKKIPRLNQTRVSMGPVILNNALPASFTRRATRAEIMVAGAPTVLGHDSTANKERLPEQWVLVDEINVEGRSDNQQRVVLIFFSFLSFSTLSVYPQLNFVQFLTTSFLTFLSSTTCNFA